MPDPPGSHQRSHAFPSVLYPSTPSDLLFPSLFQGPIHILTNSLLCLSSPVFRPRLPSLPGPVPFRTNPHLFLSSPVQAKKRCMLPATAFKLSCVFFSFAPRPRPLFSSAPAPFSTNPLLLSSPVFRSRPPSLPCQDQGFGRTHWQQPLPFCGRSSVSRDAGHEGR